MKLAFWRKNNENTPPKKKKPKWREWFDAAIFALVAATIIRTFFFEAYTIPTGSMEGTLLVNDYMFVSKMTYGARMPMTPIALPLVHNTMPIIGGKSYTEAVTWDYKRLPGFRDIKRYDIVVFNFPNNDTTFLPDPAQDYYNYVRQYGREQVWSMGNVITRPVDRRENYIKRCVGMPGDIIEIKDGILYNNNKPAPIFKHQRITYAVNTAKPLSITEEFTDEYGTVDYRGNNEEGELYDMENIAAQEVKKFSGVNSVVPFAIKPNADLSKMDRNIFPHQPQLFPYTQDNFGPITIPKKGTTVQLSPDNYAIYDRIIRVYEKNNVSYTNGQFTINGKVTNSYTFKMDYYWMMGDNRHQSLDSRYWGFVPEDHIVGTPAFVWLSYHNEGITKGIRWGRLFRGMTALENK